MTDLPTLIELNARLVNEFNARIRSEGPASFPTHYGGNYAWGTDMTTRGTFKCGQLVMPIKVGTPQHQAIAKMPTGYAYKKFADHGYDIGIVIGRCQRGMASTLFMVLFSNGDVRPYPVSYLVSNLDSMKQYGEPKDNIGDAYVSTFVPKTTQQKQAEAEYVDPFAAEGQ